MPDDDPFAPKQNYAQGLLSSTRLVVAGSHMPMVVFVTVAGVFTYNRHTWPATVWLAVALALDVVVVAGWPRRRAGSTRASASVEWLPLVFGLVWLGLAVMLGSWNATLLETYTRATYLRPHTDVLPTDDPRAYADAGVLRFADGSQVDVASSAGFRSWPHTYCAAPIRGPSDPVGPLGFWAVGRDCCDSRGGFTCNGAMDPKAGSGIQMRIDSKYAGSAAGRGAAGLGYYGKAVRMAAAAIGEVAAEDPVLVVWERNPYAAAHRAWWYATTAYCVQVLFAMLCCAASWYLLQSIARVLPAARMA